MNLGYCCINTTLAEKDIRVNRGLRRKTLQEKGLEYCADLIIQNLDDCLKILEWNVAHDIYGYRMSSAMFPWMSEYKNIIDLPRSYVITNKLTQIGRFIRSNQIRAGFHPDHFNVLGSENTDVVLRTAHELNMHGQIMDLMGLPRNHYYSINIHVSNTKPNKKEALKRFKENVSMLNSGAHSRLTVENDDKPNGYTVEELRDNLYQPIVFDNLHWECNKGKLDFEAAYNTALFSWPEQIRPLVHWSSSRRLNEDKNAKVNAHADFIYDKIPWFYDVDVEFEAKAKEKALINYREKFQAK